MEVEAEAEAEAEADAGQGIVENEDDDDATAETQPKHKRYPHGLQLYSGAASLSQSARLGRMGRPHRAHSPRPAAAGHTFSTLNRCPFGHSASCSPLIPPSKMSPPLYCVAGRASCFW